MVVHDIKLRSRLSNNIHLSRDFLAILGVKVVGNLKCFSKCFFGSLQIISRLDSQSKFQIFTLFTGRHIGGSRGSSNMAAPY